MNVLNQIYYTAKRFLMDFKPIVIMIVSYMIIILILGSAFESEFENSDLETVHVLYVNDDAGEYGNNFLNELINMDEIKDLIQFEKAESYEDAEKKIKDEEADALVYLPEEFSKQVENQEDSSVVKVYRSRYSGINATVVQSVMESYVSGLNAAGVVYQMTGSLEGFQFDMDEGIEEQPLTKEGKVPDSIGYYAVAMVMMMLLFGADYGNQGISEEYHGAIGDRMRLSQIKPFQQYTGKIIGISLVQFMQALIIILFTKVAYDVYWGHNAGILLLIIFTFCVLTTTFGGMLSLLMGDKQKASTIISTAVFVFTFLAGGFVVIDFGFAKYFSINYYGQSAVTNLIYDGSMALVTRNILLMWAFILVFILVSVVKAGRKRA